MKRKIISRSASRVYQDFIISNRKSLFDWRESFVYHHDKLVHLAMNPKVLLQYLYMYKPLNIME